jgi:hypothetical protein
MKLWIDNTALHATGRCLSGKGQDKTDVDSLLQLASQIIFSDEIHFSADQNSSIRQLSLDIRGKLIDYGLDKSVIVAHGSDDYEHGCINAAKNLATDLQFSSYVFPLFKPRSNDEGIAGISHPELPNGQLLKIRNRIHDFIIGGLSDYQRRTIIDATPKTRADNADEYMIAACSELFEQIQSLAIQNGWKLENTEALIVQMRYYLNQELAHARTASYSPAVPRARVLSIQTSMIFQQIQIQEMDEVLKHAVQKLEPKNSMIPSVANILVYQSRGNPDGIIKEAIAIRERALPLRKILYSKIKGDDVEDLYETKMKIREMGQVLQKDLGIIPSPILIDAFEFQFMGLVPIPKLKHVHSWAKFQLDRKRVSVLSEFAKISASDLTKDSLFEDYLSRLSLNSCK